MPPNLFWSVLLASFAWLVGKRWEIAERRRQRYIEVAAHLSALFGSGDAERRSRLLNEVAKLWIDADRNVVLAAERALNAVQNKDADADLELRRLIVAMRTDARFVWNRSDLSPEDIKLRQAD